MNGIRNSASKVLGGSRKLKQSDFAFSGKGPLSYMSRTGLTEKDFIPEGLDRDNRHYGKAAHVIR